MSVVPDDALLTRDVAPESPDPRRTDSKFSLALDAVTGQKSHAADAVGAYLDALIDVLTKIPIIAGDKGAFDARVLSGIETSRAQVNQFRNLLAVIAETDRVNDFLPHLTTFLEGALSLKKNARVGPDQAYLWRDGPGFLCRELFLSTTTALLSNSCWHQVHALLTHRYRIQGAGGEWGFSAFDGYQRSLDVFRNRRLKLGRPSISADVLENRVRESALSFSQVTQADIVLHIHSLLESTSLADLWHCRTLGSAHAERATGFELFTGARAGRSTGFLRTVLQADDWAGLQQKVEAALLRLGLGQDCGVDYPGYLGGSNSTLIH